MNSAPSVFLLQVQELYNIPQKLVHAHVSNSLRTPSRDAERKPILATGY